MTAVDDTERLRNLGLAVIVATGIGYRDRQRRRTGTCHWCKKDWRAQIVRSAKHLSARDRFLSSASHCSVSTSHQSYRLGVRQQLVRRFPTW
jgi:hypothetical protein